MRLSMPRLFAITALATTTALLSACSRGGDDEAQDLADQAAGDLDELVALAADLGAGAEAIEDEDGGRNLATETYDTIGDCSVTAELDGFVLNGTFAVSAVSTPCGVVWEGDTRSLEYRVDAFTLAGDWSGTLAGDYSITVTGSRDAALIVTTPRSGTNEFDSSFSLDTLTAEYIDGAVTELAATLTYAGYAGQAWSMSVTTAAGAFSGSLTAPDGTVCTATGTVGDAAFSCD